MRSCLPKPASGPDRSSSDPITTSSFVTPCVCAPASGTHAARASATIVRFILDLPLFTSHGIGRRPSSPLVHRLDQRCVFLLHELALELHRRRELLVLGGELRLDEPEGLDLFDARELAVDLVDLALDERDDLGRAR